MNYAGHCRQCALFGRIAPVIHVEFFPLTKIFNRALNLEKKHLNRSFLLQRIHSSAYLIFIKQYVIEKILKAKK